MLDGLLRSARSHGANWTLAGIIGLLVVTAVSIVPLTLTVLHLRQSDAVVIDVAGRQRMLLERHMKELLLAADGVDTPLRRTRDLLRERLTVLVRGGTTLARLDQEERLTLPAAPTDEIRTILEQQQRLLQALVVKADRFLAASNRETQAHALRDDLLKEHGELLRIANEAVTQLARHSEARVRTVIWWELAMVLLVVTVASVGAFRFVQAERALKRSQAAAMEALRQSDAVKSSLLSSVSHELRTPLTAIKAMLFNLCDGSDGPPAHVRQEFVDGIHEELDYLNQLVGNLLDMSRLDAGTLKPNREWHLLDELVEGAIRRVGPRLEHRPLHVGLAPDLPPIFVDGVAIQQVLINLLDNAVKFSRDESPVRIGAVRSDQDVEVTVSNEGVGIPPEELGRVFDRFYRATDDCGRATPGIGLGLAICKGIVEAHGGRITAHSVPGRVTTLTVRLPVMPDVPSHDGTVVQPTGARG